MSELNGLNNGGGPPRCDNGNIFGTTEVPLQPNPDIAGIGVIISFLLSAYLPLLFIICSYVGGVVPIQLLSRADTDFFRVKFRRRSQWHKTLVKAILLFSDQQIVTGIAIMVAVYSRLDTTSIYHFRVAMFLAWMSSNTHLTTLVVLRRYLMKSTILRVWRLTGMVVLYAMLLVALIPGCFWNWEQLTKGRSSAIFDHAKNTMIFFNPNLPASCIFHPPDRASVDADLAAKLFPESSRLEWSFNIVLVTGLYLIKTSLLFSKLSYTVFYLFKAWPLYIIEKGLRRSADASVRQATIRHNTGGSAFSRPAHLRRFARFRYRALVSIYVIVISILDTLQTFIANILLLAWGTVWGTIEVFNASFTFNGNDNQEGYWGFGQILPMMLLLLPIASVIDSLFGTRDKEIGQGTHHELIEEGSYQSSTASSSSSTLTTPSVSRSNSRLNRTARLSRPPSLLPELTEADFTEPPRYQAVVNYPKPTHVQTDLKVPYTETYDWSLESPMETPGPGATFGKFPMPPRSTSPLPPGSVSPLPPRSISPLPPRSTSPMPTRGRSTSIHEKARGFPDLETQPAPHQFIGGPRPADQSQRLSEYFQNSKPYRPQLRDPTPAAFAEDARTLMLHRYLYRTWWCQAVFAIHTLAMIVSIVSLSLYGILDSKNPLNSWNSTVTISEVWVGAMFIWWLIGFWIKNDIYK